MCVCVCVMCVCVCVCVCSEHGTMVYEVTGQVRVQAQVPWLQSALVLLRGIIDLVQDLVDKVSGGVAGGRGLVSAWCSHPNFMSLKLTHTPHTQTDSHTTHRLTD